MAPPSEDVSHLRTDILRTYHEFQEVYDITRLIQAAMKQQEPFREKRAVRGLRAYRQGVDADEIEVESAVSREERNALSERRQRELSEAKEDLAERKQALRKQVETQIRELVDHLCEADDTTKEKIISLKTAVESNIRGDVIADALDCSSGYPGQFQWHEDAQQVLMREDVKRRKANRFSESKKGRIRRRDDGQCVKCGSGDELRVHHIIPIESGGTNEVENGATLCMECHRELHRLNNGPGESYDSFDEFWKWTDS